MKTKNVCQVCGGQGRIWLNCQMRCGGKRDCIVCSGMGKVYTTCTKCKGSGYS
jgi:hypothetical protein